MPDIIIENIKISHKLHNSDIFFAFMYITDMSPV